ncbi:MAG: FKBP-type peptidyl-prolyl cis-trans isomerase [Cellvibrionaceae bacterium]
MKINDKCVASFHYTLKNDAGETIDSSSGQEPMSYLQGASNIVPGLEKEMEGKSIGDSFSVVISPAEGYGEVDENLHQELPKSMFTGVENIEPGMEFQAQTEHGQQIIAVTKVEGDTVTVDGNHPLAGENLHFDIEVTDIREASQEELDHGHVHGPGGHEH